MGTFPKCYLLSVFFYEVIFKESSDNVHNIYNLISENILFGTE